MAPWVAKPESKAKCQHQRLIWGGHAATKGSKINPKVAKFYEKALNKYSSSGAYGKWNLGRHMQRKLKAWGGEETAGARYLLNNNRVWWVREID